MTKDEALKLALEALETELCIDWTNNDEFNASAEQMHEAITAIKKALAHPEERNFCPRCGKRTADLATIHTCTPPQIDPNQWAFDNGLEST